MRKKLILPALLGLLLVSCQQQPESKVPASEEEAVLFENEQTYGRKDSEVTCGPRRSADGNSNMWDLLPDYPTDEERAGVLEYISGRPEAVEWPGYTSFYIQHVTGANITYTYKDHNGAEHQVNGTTSFEQLRILENSGAWAYPNNFNGGKANNSASHDCCLMTDGLKDMTALNEYSGGELEKWKVYYWEGNYYIGMDFYVYKSGGTDIMDPDGCYSDWIMKIIPGQNETPVEPIVAGTGTGAGHANPAMDTLEAHVEFDVHQQKHTDWNEIKTSIHLRDTVNARIFIPVPQEYQALADDFDLRLGDQYEYVVPQLTICDKTYDLPIRINHLSAGIEILIKGDDLEEALRAARAAFYDGITYEIHSYVYYSVTPDQIWSWLSTTEPLQTQVGRMPVSGDCVTHTFGQVTSAYYTEDGRYYDIEPAE